IASSFPLAPAERFALGIVEAWRGPVIVALESGPEGTIRRCHPHDPSWQNWPVLEHAVIGNIVPDFPLINKSFNLSYSGHDLYRACSTSSTRSPGSASRPSPRRLPPP